LRIDNWKLFQFFKYVVYILLATNVYLFFREEFAAAAVQFPAGIPVGDLIEAFAATIDTAAWVVLLLMFELETYVLEDRHFTPPVKYTLHGLRFLCYAFIVYAFYGYIVNVVFFYDVSVVAGVADLCALPAGNWSYAVLLDEYVDITATNCASLSESQPFYRIGELQAVVDGGGLWEIRALAWVDAINAAVWILVVVVLEIDVRLQEKGRLEGRILRTSNATKFVLYSILFLAAVYWGFKGDFVDFWDAFLWLVAFFFIEMNVVEWRQEQRGEQVLGTA